MSRIVKFRVAKCNTNDKRYKGKHYPVFYFEGDEKNGKRMFSMAKRTKADVEADAKLYVEAHNREYEILDAINTGIAVEGMEQKPIVELLDEYLDSLKLRNLKEATIIEKRGVINNVIKPFYGDKMLCELSEKMMVDYKLYCNNQKSRKVTNNMGVAPLSSRRIQKFWEINKTFVNWLREEKNYITKDPMDDIKRPKARNMNVSKYWKAEEFDRFLEVIPKDSQDVALFLLAFLTGMREGEILGLTWADIDFDNSDVKIEKQFNTKTHKIETPKTESSHRKTKIPDIVLDELRKLKERTKEYYFISDKKLQTIPVFTNGRLENLSGKTVSNHMTKYILESNVKKIKFHELRNSFITNSIDSGISPDVVAEMVGHAKVTTTMDIYKCTTDVHKEQALDVINEFASQLKRRG